MIQKCCRLGKWKSFQLRSVNDSMERDSVWCYLVFPVQRALLDR